MFAVIHEEPAHKAGNYVEGEWIVRTDQGVLRSFYHRDGYEAQSYLKTEVWTEAGWTTVVRQTGYELDMPSYVARTIDHKLIQGFVARQQDVAISVLGG